MPPVAPPPPPGSSTPGAPPDSLLSAATLAPLIPLVRETHELLAIRYQQEEYRPRTYERLKERFADLEFVEAQDIEQALAWKYGAAREPVDTIAVEKAVHWFAANRTQAARCQSWLLLLQTLHVELPFRTAAFLAHLACPLEVPPLDQYSFLAMRYLLRRCGLPAPRRELPEVIQDLLQLQTFTTALTDACQPMFRDKQGARQFLMMFGKHLAPPVGTASA